MSKKSYIVSWSVTKYYYIEVEAEDEQEARQEALDADPHHDLMEVNDIEVDEVQGSEVVDV
jgi:phosphoribosylformylglycinamidine (FGAM) synthase PurS component